MAFNLKKISQGYFSPKRLEWFSISLVPLITFLAILAITALVIAPRIGAILAVRRVIEEKSTKISKLEAKLKIIKSLQISDIEKDLRTVRRSLPDQKDVLGVVVGIQRVAAETGVEISLLTTQPGEVSETEAAQPKMGEQKPQESDLGIGEPKLKKEQAKPPPSQQPPPQAAPQNLIDINLTINAKEGGDQNSFEKARNFLVKLFESRRIFSLKLASFTTSTEGDIPSLSVSLSLSAFFQPLPKELGPIDTPILPITSEEKQFLSKLEEFEVISEKIFPKTSGKTNPFK